MVDFSQARVTMVDTQVRPSDVTRFPVIEAMLAVPREAFVPAALKAVSYTETHVPLGPDRVLLDPRTLAKLVNAIDPGPEDVVLDVGCGLGYSTAIIARMAKAVVGIESDAARAAEAQDILSGLGVDNAAIIAGPLTDGEAAQGPYDAILINGGSVETLPEKLTGQLREGGRIAALFTQGSLGVARIGHAYQGRIIWRDSFNVSAPQLKEFVLPRGFTF